MNYEANMNENVNHVYNRYELDTNATAIVYNTHGWYSVMGTDEYGTVVYENGPMTIDMAREEYLRLIE